MGNIIEGVEIRPPQDKNTYLPINGFFLPAGSIWGNHGSVFITYTSEYQEPGDIAVALNHILANGFCWSNRDIVTLELDQYALPIALRNERAARRQGTQEMGAVPIKPPVATPALSSTIVYQPEIIKPKVRKPIIPSNRYINRELDPEIEILTYKDIKYNPRERRVELPSAFSVTLGVTEGRLFRLFMTRPEKVLPYSWLIDKVWKGRDVSDTSLSGLVGQVRRKIHDKSLTHRHFKYINSGSDKNGIKGYLLAVTDPQCLQTPS